MGLFIFCLALVVAVQSGNEGVTGLYQAVADGSQIYLENIRDSLMLGGYYNATQSFLGFQPNGTYPLVGLLGYATASSLGLQPVSLSVLWSLCRHPGESSIQRETSPCIGHLFGHGETCC